jgi:hypothetical protein
VGDNNFGNSVISSLKWLVFLGAVLAAAAIYKH